MKKVISIILALMLMVTLSACCSAEGIGNLFGNYMKEFNDAYSEAAEGFGKAYSEASEEFSKAYSEASKEFSNAFSDWIWCFIRKRRNK